MAIEYPRLDGHVALVTGGRRGIGRGIARRLAAQGAAVVIGIMDKDEPYVAETVEMFGGAGYRLALLECDLSQPAARADAIARASEPFGAIDILVNNAALNTREPGSDMPLAQRRAMMEVNVHAPIELAQQCLPQMRAQGWGRIVNLLSASMTAPPISQSTPRIHTYGLIHYGATKCALRRYTQALAIEMSGTGIHVNGYYPQGACVTEESSQSAIDGMRGRPEVAESIQVMAEAAMLLIAGPTTGMSISSRDLLEQFQQPVRDFDGVTVLGDASLRCVFEERKVEEPA